MHPAASLRLLLLALGVAVLFAASAAASDVDAAVQAGAQADAQADVPSGLDAATSQLALPETAVQAPDVAEALQPQVDVQASVEAVGVQADAGLGVAPGAGPSDGPALHPDQAGGGEVAPGLAAQAAPVAAVAVGLAAGGFALRLLLSLLPTGLFSRIERGQLLDNPVRARVHDAVASEPGLTLSDVRSRAGIAWGTTVHHLRRLEANGIIVSVSQRAHRRYFIANTPAAAQRVPLSAILHPTARRIATLVAAQDGIGRSGLCAALGLNGPAASKHLEQFRRHGLVVSERDGRRTRHHATSDLHAALGLLEGAAPQAASAAPYMSVRLAGLSLTAA